MTPGPWSPAGDTTPWRPVAEDDPLDGLRDALAEADCGYEPRGGYEDSCWILHTIHDGPVRLRWDEVLSRAGRSLEDWPGTLSYLVFEDVAGTEELEGPDPAELDRASLARLVDHLVRNGPRGADTPAGPPRRPPRHRSAGPRSPGAAGSATRSPTTTPWPTSVFPPPGGPPTAAGSSSPTWTSPPPRSSGIAG